MANSTPTTNKSLIYQANNTADGSVPASVVYPSGFTYTSWDYPENYNAQTIDVALGGVATVTVTGASGTVALTAASYQPLTMIFSGVLSSNVIYTLPSGVGGVWLIRNNTSGNFTITLQSLTSGASAQVVLPQDGLPYLVACSPSSGTSPTISNPGPSPTGGGVYFIYYLPDNSVTTAKIVDSSVTTAKLANYTITNLKLLPSVIDGLAAKTAFDSADELSLFDSAAVKTITTISVSGASSPYLATAITPSAHGLNVGDSITVAGATGNTSVNGVFTVLGTPTTTQFTYNVTSNAAVTGTPTFIANPGLKKITWANVQAQLTSVISAGTAAQYLANTPATLLGNNQVWTAATTVALTDAATIAVDMSTFLNATVTLGGNRTLGNPSNMKVGQTGYIAISQDTSGSRTLAYSSYWKFGGGVAPVLSTAANALDLLFYQVLSATSVLGSLVKGVA
jgi:hypothetical protein